jgi:RimJ/RimL family protein N-acetyltransferase
MTRLGFRAVADQVILQTERLRLVPLGPEHVEELWNVYSDPEVARYVGGDALTPDSTRGQTNRWAQTWADRGYGQSAWIGWAGANFSDDHLIAVINPHNTPSLRLAARLGFKPERSETVRDVQVVVHRLDLDR